MSQKFSEPTAKPPAEKLVREIRRVTRKHHSAEDKIRIVLEGLRGEESIATLCRREAIAESLHYAWSKEFLEAGKRCLAGDTARAPSAARRAALPAIATPGNPLEVTGICAVDGDVFRASLDALLANPGVATVACMQDVREGHWALHQAARLASEAARAQPKPVFLFSNTSRVFDATLGAILTEGEVKLVCGRDETVRAASAACAARHAGCDDTRAAGRSDGEGCGQPLGRAVRSARDE